MSVSSSKHDIRKNELLDIAQNIFYLEGYEDTSVQDILNAAGIAKGTFYHYFKSKEALLDILVERFNSSAFSSVEEIVALDISPTEKFEKVFRSIRDIKVENIELMIALSRFLYNDSNLLLREKMNRNFFQFLTPILAKIISDGVLSGIYSSDDPQITSEIILSLFLKYGEQITPLWNHIKDDPAIILNIERKMRMLIDAVEKILVIPSGTINLIDKEVFDYFIEKININK